MTESQLSLPTPVGAQVDSALSVGPFRHRHTSGLRDGVQPAAASRFASQIKSWKALRPPAERPD